MDFHVAIRSYNRPQRVKTIALIPSAQIWVPESQEAAYRAEHGDAVRTIPDEQDGNCPKKSNAILNALDGENVLIVDDDISGIGFHENGRRYWMKPDHILEMIEDGFRVAEGLNIALWGLNQNADPMSYRIFTPLGFLTPILGPWGGHLRPTLRYDEDSTVKEDYDFWLQNIRAYRRTLRFNRYFYEHEHGITQGGLASIRTRQLEMDAIRYMQKKWGDLFRPFGTVGGKSATGENYLNSRAKVPIPGC